MDTFLNKLSQKVNAQEMIKANSAADTAKMEMMQQQMDKYDALLQEMRKVNLKTIENMEQLKKVTDESLQKIEAVKETGGIKEEMDSFIEKTGRQQEEIISLIAAANGQYENIMPEVKKQVEEVVKQSDDFLHKENVKVYRNVQAAMTEELDKQTEKLAAGQKDSAKCGKVIIPLSIVTILLLIADIVINLLNITVPF